MPEQSFLPGFDAPKLTDRLFFAVFPAAQAAARMARLALQLRDEHGLHGKPLQTERFHVVCKNTPAVIVMQPPGPDAREVRT